MFGRLSIKAKLILLVSTAMVILTLFLVSFSVHKIKTSLIEENNLKLTALRDSKSNQIENFFKERIGDIKVLAKSEELHFLLADLIKIEHDLHIDASQKYPIDNALVNEKIALHDEFFQNYAKEYGYYDIFFITLDGHVVYTQARESDWGENLKSGKLKDSGLAIAWREAIEKKRPVFTDMKPYAPSNGEPAMFLSEPVFYKGEMEGIIVFQISDKLINNIMKFRNGYGKSQEDYLIGGDHLMRSDSYLDPEGHSLRASFKNNATVETVAVKEALEGKSNTAIIQDYNGNPVLSAYAPIKIGEDLTWAILSEIDEAEILEKPNELRNTTILVSIIILVIILLISIYIINTSIVKKLINFQNGLINFFAYLNKEKDYVELINDKSYDEIGTMSKVVNENITKTQKLIEEDTQLIENVKEIVEEIKNGKLTKKIEKSTINETLNELKTIINEMIDIMAQNVCGDMNKIQFALKEFQSLNFTHRVSNPTGKTSQGLNSLAEIINDMLVENKSNGLTLENSSNTLMKNVEVLSSSSNQAAASLEETAAALEEITSTIVNSSDSVSHMNNAAQSLSKSAKKGQGLADNTTVAMDDITEQVTLINEAISVIDQIAFQTNILSLNAAVEAATAGEAGKGFAVVAQEVRNLASRSAEAAKEIKDLVENATNKASQGKDISAQMILGYEDLLSDISEVTQRIDEISRVSSEQRSGITQINDAINQLDQQTQQNAQVANETRQIADNTLTIATTVVKNANAKEFIGKDDVKAKEL